MSFLFTAWQLINDIDQGKELAMSAGKMKCILRWYFIQRILCPCTWVYSCI